MESIFFRLALKAAEHAREHNTMLQAHMNEYQGEVDGIIAREGMRPYEYLEKLPTKKEKDAHIRAVEKGIKKQYTPQMKKLTYSQGKLLIKLVNRECNQSSFEIVKAFFGPFKAGFYQTFASIFGASLKKDYDPEADDRLTERVVRMVEAGTL